MDIISSRVTELRADASGNTSLWVQCPARCVPSPGRYVKAWNAENEDEVLPTALFPAEVSDQGFLAAPPLPPSWMPGTILHLQGPLGTGFRLGDGVRRLALAALARSPDRLLPLIPPALAQGADVTLFTAGHPPSLPSAVEISPLSALPDALGWADFLALDLPLEILPKLRRMLQLEPEARLTFPAQALLYTAMPCAGMAECGVCAVPMRRGWKLACKDGPVFDLEDLDW